MIVPMKKISLVVLEKERRQALKDLRKLGVVHLEEVEGKSEELSLCKKKTSVLETAISILSEIKAPKKAKAKSIDKDAAFELAREVTDMVEEKKTLYLMEIMMINY